MDLPRKVIAQITKAGLPTGGQCPFAPKLVRNRRGELIIKKDIVLHGPKKGKRGFVDDQERIWIRDYGYADVADHWDVQEDRGKNYLRVDDNGNLIS